MIFPSCELFYLQSFEVSTIYICGWHLCISEPPSCLAVSIIGMCYGKEDGKRNKKNTRTRVLLFIPFFISLPRTHSNYRNNQARWRLGNAEMSIVVTSNDGKKNSSRLGKITSLDFNYKTCLVRVPNASYRCAVWKFSKKAGFAKVFSAETLTGTGYTKHQVYRLNVASNWQRLMSVCA